MSIAAIQTTYDRLSILDQVDLETSAYYRRMAQEILADLNISFNWRQMIADRLNEANQLLGMVYVGDSDDSY
jgi:hypothetical protein